MISIRTLCLTTALCLWGTSAWAQIGGNQSGTTGGTTGTRTGGTTTGTGTTSGTGGLGGQSTTGGLGGQTTQGVGAGGTAGQDVQAGSNAAQGFIGASDLEGFVGGARESEINSQLNRLFRGITDAEVPTGTSQESTGNPRRIPVQLRLGFTPPAPQQAIALAGYPAGSLDPYISVRPELRQVRVTLSENGTATLTGTTDNAASRRLAENLMRLQPGVRRVNSQIRSTSIPSIP